MTLYEAHFDGRRIIINLELVRLVDNVCREGFSVTRAGKRRVSYRWGYLFDNKTHYISGTKIEMKKERNRMIKALKELEYKKIK